MVLVQIYLTATTQNVDLNLPPARYRIRCVGIQYNYGATNDHTNLFTIQFRSTWTMQKYGQRYLVQSNPGIHHANINGPMEYEGIYSGAFEMVLIDLSTGVAPVTTAGATNRFTTAVLSFDVTKISETNTVPE
jgi:hypothetical protein